MITFMLQRTVISVRNHARRISLGFQYKLYAEFWHPLTWLSLMFDYHLYGLNAGGYHVTNVILHILSTLLLFCIFNRYDWSNLEKRFCRGLFLPCIHLRVESVAWVAERKDVLSIFFGLASIYSYTLYVEKFQFSKYFLCLILFAFSLMAKSTLVTLPFVLCLWIIGRWVDGKWLLLQLKVPIAATEREKRKILKSVKRIPLKRKRYQRRLIAAVI